MRTLGVNSRLQPFGATIFAQMTALAVKHDAVNLGQGAPDFDGPEFLKEAAIKAIRDGRGQYARMTGLPELTSAIAQRFMHTSGVSVDPEREIVVTCGATEAILDCMLALLEPGDEVLLFEPFYDSYLASVAMAGGVAKVVTLEAPEFRIDENSMRAAITPKTRVMLVNSPHNPSGRILDDAERAAIVRVANEFDLIVISDEVYEELWYETPHRTLMTEPGMRERTIVLGSVGKSFSFTGWKVGWAIASAPLAAAVRSAHQFASFCAPTPLQIAAATALAAPAKYFEDFRAEYRARRDRMINGVRACGFTCASPEGSYFVLADHSAFGFADDVAFCRHLVEHGGIASIPPSAFYVNKAKAKHLVRFAFCKKDATLDAALTRLSIYRERVLNGEFASLTPATSVEKAGHAPSL
ncbi:MAG: aminotransferase class I/II-fold pyridoxal phosphate-dependent enzyme [Planctomycetota bacterium]|nr:MAG: aminotransferase class I/II-fold pyridoxal phosphate-dependent enzyme [Planctomycetota bacterium]